MKLKPISDSYWVLPDRFLAGAYPARPFNDAVTRQRLVAFLNAGFDTFIDLTNANERPDYASMLSEEAGYDGMSVSHQRFSFPDFNVPSRTTMVATLDAIDAALDGGHKVYLHCVGGIGRTGTTVACYLVRHGMEPAQALRHLGELYQDAEQSHFSPHSPEADGQIRFILTWEEHGLA